MRSLLCAVVLGECGCKGSKQPSSSLTVTGMSPQGVMCCLYVVYTVH